jgi:hypothetical protein
MANHNAKGKIGNRGGGRPSVREEFYVYNLIKKYFEEPIDWELLEKKIKTKKFTLLDMMVYRALKSDPIANNLINKLVPTKMQQEINGEIAGAVVINMIPAKKKTE